MRAFLEKIAPLNNAEKIRKPIFVIQGANDPRVPMSESVQMVQKIRGVGTPVWYLMAKDEGHGFAKKNNRDFMMYSSIEFIKKVPARRGRGAGHGEPLKKSRRSEHCGIPLSPGDGGGAG
jgi:dipeptidyl aminopeptidase/acylaminoacyl peptidase